MAQDNFAIEQFYDELAPYGEWVRHPTYGYVWLPLAVGEGWRPYTVGQWIPTDEYGWYWDSYEPFAWAVYHYGRWGYDPNFGWFWVPGDTWAPAWVQWRYGDDQVGWAPVPPSSYGAYAYGGQAGYAPPPINWWVFVRPLYLTSPTVYRYALPPREAYFAYSRAPYAYRPQFRNGYYYNYGMPRDRWSRLTRQHIEPRKIYRGHYRDAPYGWNKGRGRDIYVYAPGVRKGVKPARAPKKVAHKPSKKWVNRATESPGTINPNLRGPGSTVIDPNARLKSNNTDKHKATSKPSNKKTSNAKSNSKSSNSKASNAKSSNSKSSTNKQAKAKQDNGPPKPKPNYAPPHKVNPDAAGPGSTVINPNARYKPDNAGKPKASNAKPNGNNDKDKGEPKAAKAKGDKDQPGNGQSASSGGGNGAKAKAKNFDRSALCKARPNAPQCKQQGG
ncbi:MAG: DUF6600 domain-containing protein [Methyloceanibacter sp.]|uniref:DUF6600 domain-containing protein n=1 Tax=Methyloceanibacter sp. TaxID=1965321 RepID=UPI003D6D096B